MHMFAYMLKDYDRLSVKTHAHVHTMTCKRTKSTVKVCKLRKHMHQGIINDKR